MTAVVCSIAAVVAFLAGTGVGGMLADGYLSRRQCRECRRLHVRYGFCCDGVHYVAVPEKEKERR